jgi:hypothetical protein
MENLLSPLSFHEDGHFDWVLDFCEPPQVQTDVPPLGHCAVAAQDFPGLKRVLLEIAGRVREGFEKPRYFRFDARLCAHSRQGDRRPSVASPAWPAAAAATNRSDASPIAAAAEAAAAIQVVQGRHHQAPGQVAGGAEQGEKEGGWRFIVVAQVRHGTVLVWA